MSERPTSSSTTFSLPLARPLRSGRRLKRLTGRFLLPGAVAGALFVAVAAYAYFSTSGTGTGSATVGTLSPPVVNPPGAPNFNVTNMVPGDSDTNSMTVTVNGGPPSNVSIYDQNPTGTLLSALNLKIVEDGSTVLYNGPLASGPTAGSPLALPGSGAGGSWPAGEQHSFDFTVSFPTGGNSLQSTNASVNFVWQRKLG
jgi:hypothetical protein